MWAMGEMELSLSSALRRWVYYLLILFFFFQAEDGIRDVAVTGVQTCALPIFDVDVTPLLPKDDASFGFDNVGVSNLSPTLLERYLAAAQKISRLAVGLSGQASGVNVVTLPVDFTQENHIDGLPFGTRGGTLVRHTFPLDGKYEIRVRLMRNRNENVEGLNEPHDMELTL